MVIIILWNVIDMKKQLINLTDKHWKKLQKYKIKEGESISGIIRKALDKYFKGDDSNV